jgi:hypothetical protein
MFKLLLISVVAAPVLLGMLAARTRGRRGLALLLAFLVTYNTVYMLMLYYLQVRWVGW